MAKLETQEKELRASTPETGETPPQEDEDLAPKMEERVITVDRVSRTQKGGRRIRFRALVVVGDHQGNVGLGTGKSTEVIGAVQKATARAKKSMVTVPIVRRTIPHEIVTKFDSAKVMLKPAGVGTSVIAGSSMRPILELAGVENVVGKCLTRTTNKFNIAYATLQALGQLKDIKEIAPRHYSKSRKAKKAEATPEAVQAPAVEEAPIKKTARKTAKKSEDK